MTIANIHQRVRQEEDVLPPRLLVYVILAFIAFSFLIVAVAYGILRSREYALRPSGQFSELWLGPIKERSNVFEDLYGNAGSGQWLERTEHQSLERFEWVDQEKQRVRVPIDVAIELYVNSSSP